jgi:hypothetical protein
MSITVQSTYLTDYVAGFPGMLADGNVTNRPTGIVQDVAGIAFGIATFQSGATDGKAITATPGTKFKGVTIANAGLVAPVGGAADTYGQYASASLCDMGDIWVLAGSNTTPGAPVYVTSAGVFTTVSTGGNIAIPATFIDAVSSGAAVRIRIVQQ